MKAVILAGGMGTRISEESHLKPKPMIQIGDKPILWHIMKIYAAHGITEFIICCGYRGYVIKEYFSNYLVHNSDVTFDFQTNVVTHHEKSVEPWKVTLVDTGEKTLTGGRLKRLHSYLQSENEFCFTYGDGVGNVDITQSIAFHRKHGKLATMTATRPSGRFGIVELDGNKIVNFQEKPKGVGGWINGGFFVLSPNVLDEIDGDDVMWERAPMERLAKQGELMAHFHDGFWQPMDTRRDMEYLLDLWKTEKAPWKVW